MSSRWARVPGQPMTNNEGFPSREREFVMRRRKPRSIPTALLYRVTRLLRVFGRRRLLRAYLYLSWILKRLAFELSGEVFGDSFPDHALGLSDEIIAEFVPSGSLVVDLGCSSGRLCRRLAGQAGRVVGIDNDSSRLNMARREPVPANVSYVLGDITLPLPEQIGERKVDSAFLVHVLEHIDDSDRFLTDLRSFAGSVIVEVPDFDSDPLNHVRWRLGTPWYSDADHVREYTKSTLVYQLERTGWDLIHVEQRGGSIVAVARGLGTPETYSVARRDAG